MPTGLLLGAARRSLCAQPLQHHRRGLVVRILRDELLAEGLVEDRAVERVELLPLLRDVGAHPVDLRESSFDAANDLLLLRERRKAYMKRENLRGNRSRGCRMSEGYGWQQRGSLGVSRHRTKRLHEEVEESSAQRDAAIHVATRA